MHIPAKTIIKRTHAHTNKNTTQQNKTTQKQAYAGGELTIMSNEPIK